MCVIILIYNITCNIKYYTTFIFLGTLKTRFRCILNKERVLKYHPQKTGMIINACCILQIMCMRANLPLDDELEMDNMAIEVNHNVPIENVLNAGRSQRANIVNRYFL